MYERRQLFFVFDQLVCADKLRPEQTFLAFQPEHYLRNAAVVRFYKQTAFTHSRDFSQNNKLTAYHQLECDQEIVSKRFSMLFVFLKRLKKNKRAGGCIIINLISVF